MGQTGNQIIMKFKTDIDIQESIWKIEPQTSVLFLGSCFADNIGKMFLDNAFHVLVNPQGTLYNPASISRVIVEANSRDFMKTTSPLLVFITLGTNHVYRLKSTGEIVINCQKRPASLFQEEKLSIDECSEYLQKTVDAVRQTNPEAKIIFTVSPIRYAKYGFHESQLSKSILLVAADKVISHNANCTYFPAYEIVVDELRDYRYYNPDMLHPSMQTVEYIWERLVDTYFSSAAKTFISEWKPINDALHHKPFNPDSAEYKSFIADVLSRQKQFFEKWKHGNPKK